MTDSITVFTPGWRLTDDSDNPVSGGTLEFYNAGTSTPRTVYTDYGLSTALGTSASTDSSGYPVNGSGTKTLIYTGSTAFKIIAKNALGTTLWTHDNIKGALDTSGFGSGGADSGLHVTSKATDFSVATDESGYVYNCDTSGGTFAATLPSSVTVGNGFRIWIRHAGGTGKVKIAPTGGQDIAVSGGTADAFSLTGVGHTVELIADGAGWVIVSEIPPLIGSNMSHIVVADRLATPPANPASGARYIIAGTPLGAWAADGFAEHDVAEANGQGGWTRYIPPENCGWVAFVQSDATMTQFQGTAWVDWSNITEPDESPLKYVVIAHTAADGTNGGVPATGAWTLYPAATEVVNTLGTTFSTGVIANVPAGSYAIDASIAFLQTNTAQIRIRSSDGTIIYGTNAHSNSGGGYAGASSSINSILVLAAQADLTVEYVAASAAGSTGGLGLVNPQSGNVETYGYVRLLSIQARQGPKGDPGDQGATGAVGYNYKWSTATASVDPTNGYVALNNATAASATLLKVSQTDRNAIDLTSAIASWDDSTSASRARVRIVGEVNPAKFVEFVITGAGTDQGAWWSFPITVISSGTAFSADDSVSVDVGPVGDKGDQGIPGTTVPDISGLTEDTAPSDESDWLITYDTSAGGHKKAKPKNVGFTQAGAGAVMRTMQSKFRDVVSLKDFGAAGDGSNCDTAISAALTYAGTLGTGLSIYLPTGSYRYSNFTVTKSGLILFGDGPQATSLIATAATGNTITFDGSAALKEGCGLQGLTIVNDTTRTSGAYVHFKQTQRNRLIDVEMTGAYVGVQHGSSGENPVGTYRTVITRLTRTRITSSSHGVVAYPTSALYVDGDCQFNGVTGNASAAIYLPENIDGVALRPGVSCETHDYGILATPSSGSLANVYINGVVFDRVETPISVAPTSTGSINGLYINNILTDGPVGSGNGNCIDITQSGSTSISRVQIADCNFSNARQKLINVSGVVTDISITDNIGTGGGAKTANTYPAIDFNSGASTNVVITGNKFAGTHNYGLDGFASTTNVVVGPNNFISNSTGAYDNMGSASSTRFLLLSSSLILDHVGNTQGNVLYRGSSSWSVLAPGTSGQFLKTSGAGADPAWESQTAAATQAEQEAGSITTAYTSPGTQKFHPSAAKAWVLFNGTGTPAISASYNVSSITDNGVGDYTVNLSVAFSSSSYATLMSGGATNDSTTNVNPSSASAIQVRVRSSASGYMDIAAISVAAFGDQ